MARELGHTIVPTRPSLVPLESSNDYCGEMQGFAPKNVVLSAYENDKLIYREMGEMLFTHFGVSGPLVLSASAHMRSMGSAAYRLEIDLKPALDEKKLDARILRDFEKYANKEFKNALGELAGHSMIPVLVRLSEIPEDKSVNSITRAERLRLGKLLKAFPVAISGFRPIDEAIVTAGGVSTKEVNPRTMESKLVPGLYFAGEVLDLDAYTGGFNLQIAWATRLCGLPGNSDINRKIKERIHERTLRHCHRRPQRGGKELAGQTRGKGIRLFVCGHRRDLPHGRSGRTPPRHRLS